MPNHTPDCIVVPLSRAKICLLLFGSTGFVAIAVALWPAFGLIPHGNPWFLEMATVLALAVVFFGSCGLYALWKFFDPAPGLIIGEQGIVDNSSGVSAGRIPWSEIKAFHVTTVQRQRFLTIEVQDPTKCVQRASFLKRQLVRLNARYLISANTLKIDFDELLDVVSYWFEKHRRA